MRKVRSSKRLYSINSKMLAAVSTDLLYQISPNSDNKYGKNLCKLIYAPKYKERLSLHRFAGNTYREFYVNPTYGLVGHRRTFVQQAHYLLTYLLTYSMQQMRSWEANRFSASQEIHRILRNPKVLCCVWRDRHLSLSWARSIQSMPPSHFLNIHLNIILPSKPESFKWSLSLRFPHKNPVWTYLLPVRAVWKCINKY